MYAERKSKGMSGLSTSSAPVRLKKTEGSRPLSPLIWRIRGVDIGIEFVLILVTIHVFLSTSWAYWYINVRTQQRIVRFTQLVKLNKRWNDEKFDDRGLTKNKRKLDLINTTWPYLQDGNTVWGSCNSLKAGDWLDISYALGWCQTSWVPSPTVCHSCRWVSGRMLHISSFADLKLRFGLFPC